MSSTSKSKFKYDVFISFRGTDVRDGFLSHLFHALCHKQIVTFKDDNLDRGEEISPSLLRVIEESYVALIIFSENYVNSPWCLDELVKIVDCRKRMGQVVVPIFYHVGPTDVRELTGTYGDAFTDKLESWRNALRETVEISGFESRIVKPESKLIEEIVSLVHKRVNHTFSCVSIDDGLVGIDSRVNDITSKLCTRSEDIWFLGIWGMGGIGKTTVARKIYDQISSDFESAYFVASEDVCVKSISLDLSKSGVLDLSCNVFRRMKRLRLLKFYNPYYPKEGVYSSCNGVIRIKRPRYLPCQQHAKGILNSLPDELRYLYWYGYPSKALPLKFCPKNLVQLHLVRSHVEQLCIKNQYFESLKLMDLSYSVKLIRIADLSNFPKLEILHLRGCTSLVEIQSTKSYDSELRHLNLERCRSLCYFSSFLYMKRLDFLSVEGCFKITEFPVIPRMIKCLILSKTAVKQVPWSIEHFTQLTKLDLKSCTNLETLPSNIGELHLLERLNLEGCSKLMNLPDSTCSLKSLKSLSINECRNLRELPEKIGDLKSLEKLDATRSGLRILPPSINILVKLEFLSCSGCRGLILPPFTGLPSLKMLLLQDCGLSEISESLGSLKSLWGLYLGGNNLKKLPVAIKQLSELRRLYLRGNKRLEYIPELPSTLEDLWVQNSTCLQRMLSFTEVNMNFLQVLDSRNCINLDKSWGRKIMDDVLLGIENMLPQLRHFRKQDQVFCKEVLVCGLSIAVCLAGDELPPRMKHKNENGSTIFISMEPIPVDFIVVVFSAVVASTDNEAETAIEFSESGHAFDLQFATEPRINCQSRFMTESGCTLNKCCSRAVFWDNYFKPKYAPIIEHTLVWVYIFHLKDKHRFTEASFRFAAQTESSNFRVKKCGVHVLYSVDSHEIPPLHVPSLGWSSHSTSFVSLT
ncbi:Disease resistance protein (TIR-NBS-LRR class) family [Euphorbia peplus]|nr:Disease resistance protein (TIR-NBS-LRR class) family [Euphorbia peplus]